MGMDCGFKGLVILNDEHFRRFTELRGSESDTGFDWLEQVSGLSNHSFDDYFEIDGAQPFCKINTVYKAVYFCSSFNRRYLEKFFKQVFAASSAVLMTSIEEGYADNSKRLYVKNPFQLSEALPEECAELWDFANVEDTEIPQLAGGVYLNNSTVDGSWAWGRDVVTQAWVQTHNSNGEEL